MCTRSASKLDTFYRWLEQWKVNYVDPLEEDDNPFFNLSTAVHAAVGT